MGGYSDQRGATFGRSYLSGGTPNVIAWAPILASRGNAVGKRCLMGGAPRSNGEAGAPSPSGSTNMNR